MSYQFLLLLLSSAFILQTGCAQPVKLIKDINPGKGPGGVQLIHFKGNLYFRGEDGKHGTELWRSDGTSEGTRLLKDINPGKNSSNYGVENNWAVTNDYLYFMADDGIHGKELWKTDGTIKGHPAGIGYEPGTK